MYLVVLKPEANQALKALFPQMADNVQRFFGCQDNVLKFHTEGMEIPARPNIIDTSTREQREHPGELTIPYSLIEYWFHYESDLDGTKPTFGFANEQATKAEYFGTDE